MITWNPKTDASHSNISVPELSLSIGIAELSSSAVASAGTLGTGRFSTL